MSGPIEELRSELHALSDWIDAMSGGHCPYHNVPLVRPCSDCYAECPVCRYPTGDGPASDEEAA